LFTRELPIGHEWFRSLGGGLTRIVPLMTFTSANEMRSFVNSIPGIAATIDTFGHMDLHRHMPDAFTLPLPRIGPQRLLISIIEAGNPSNHRPKFHAEFGVPEVWGTPWGTD
jgi:hypothetical protein